MITFTLDGTKHEFDADKLYNFEALGLKKVTEEHLTPNEFFEAVRQFDPEAMTVLVWLARRREGESDLKFSDVRFDLVELAETFDPGESDDEAEETETDAEPDPTDQPSGEAPPS